MLNEVPGGNVPLHHFPGHKVVICKGQELLKLSQLGHEGPGNPTWAEPASVLGLSAHLSIHRAVPALGREMSEKGTDTTSHTVLTEGGLETAGFSGEAGGDLNDLPQGTTNTLRLQKMLVMSESPKSCAQLCPQLHGHTV